MALSKTSKFEKELSDENLMLTVFVDDDRDIFETIVTNETTENNPKELLVN